jgi:hypothetical protein
MFKLLVVDEHFSWLTIIAELTPALLFGLFLECGFLPKSICIINIDS